MWRAEWTGILLLAALGGAGGCAGLVISDAESRPRCVRVERFAGSFLREIEIVADSAPSRVEFRNRPALQLLLVSPLAAIIFWVEEHSVRLELPCEGPAAAPIEGGAS